MNLASSADQTTGWDALVIAIIATAIVAVVWIRHRSK